MKGSPVRVRASAWRSGAIFWFTDDCVGVLAALLRKRIADVVLRGFAGSVAYCALSGGLGVALGTLTRNQVGAVAVVAVVIGVIDPAFAALVPEAGRLGVHAQLVQSADRGGGKRWAVSAAAVAAPLVVSALASPA